MKVLDSILYLEWAEAVACGIGSDQYLRKAKSVGRKCYEFLNDPSDKRRVLLKYESLKPEHKQKVVSYFGDPYKKMNMQPIRDMVTRDIEAERFYLEYRYDENKSLPITPDNNVVDRYTTAASWLNMLIKAGDNKKQLKNMLGMTVTEFWVNVCELIDSDNIPLPSNIKKLQAKIKDYQQNGFGSLIHKSYGNRFAAKIDCEVSESLLETLIEMPNADDPTVALRYNTWAAANNKSQISTSTVTKYRIKNRAFIAQGKYGTRPAYDFIGKVIQRRRPSAPLLLVEHDDNELDLYFQSRRKSKKGGTEIYYFNRFVICVVIDAFNDYILGWAMAETYTKDLIRLAYLDAMYHVRDLTGSFCLPWQIRSDRFGIDKDLTNDLAQFYQSLATYTPATVKVARGKYIEQSFGKKWHQVLGVFPNYSGHNITAKKKLNQDFREANQKDYPSTEQAPAQISYFIEAMRHLINDKTGLSKQEEWLQAFAQNEKSSQRQLTEMQLLIKLGTRHTHTNKITNRGITPAINCIERTYEIPEEYYLETIGKTVQVIYDPMDYSRVLVTDNASTHFIAREIELMPSAIADYEPGDRTKINDRLAEKTRHMQAIGERKQRRQDVLERERIDAESLLMAGVHSKAINHAAMIDYTASVSQPKETKQIRQRHDEGRSLMDQLNNM